MTDVINVRSLGNNSCFYSQMVYDLCQVMLTDVFVIVIRYFRLRCIAVFSVCPSDSLSVHLTGCLTIPLSVCQYGIISIPLSIYRILCRSIWLSLCLSSVRLYDCISGYLIIWLSIWLFLFLSDCLSVHLIICVSVYLVTDWLPVHLMAGLPVYL